ncbi:hypothetical protein [Crenobacter intestini]|uniref:Transposase n=1 Tax=Crenobacter intestini TaxID=2563443 RepID=A0A4T0UK86_9NEIS|nr:hypothetical protein [Crenobacter intestini]TIC78751.1 hypothetical protein E5K04_15205 [Crenobacter intestini]
MKSLFAAEERESKLSKLGDPLESVGRHVYFAALAASVDRALPRPHRYFGSRPPYPTELMIRLLPEQFQRHALAQFLVQRRPIRLGAKYAGWG